MEKSSKKGLNDLKQKAEISLLLKKKRRNEPELPPEIKQKTKAGAIEPDPDAVIRELQVHQIELELQNEELTKAKTKFESLSEKYSELYLLAPQGLFTLDKFGTIIDANTFGCSIFKTNKQKFIKRRFQLFVNPDSLPVFNVFLKALYKNKTRATCQVKLLDANKTLLDAEITGIAIEEKETGEIHFMLAVSDKSSKNDSKDELDKEQHIRILTNLITGVAHDFDNMTTLLLNNLRDMENKCSDCGKLTTNLGQTKTICEFIKKLSENLVSIIDERPPAVKISLKQEVINVIEETAAALLKDSNIVYNFDFSLEKCPVEIEREKITRVLSNLITNAREAMPGGGNLNIRARNVALEETNELGAAKGEYVEVSIKDNGIGISTQDLSEIFIPYLKYGEMKQAKGIGLGLAACRFIVKKHNGYMNVESRKGKGSTFFIYLPCKKEAINGIELSTERKSAPANNHLQKKLLVLHEQSPMLELYDESLKKEGYEIVYTQDKSEAIQLYSKSLITSRPFDAVLLTLMMKQGQVGDVVLEILREIDPNVKAIVISKHADNPVMSDYKKFGFAASMLMPMGMKKALEIVRKVVNS